MPRIGTHTNGLRLTGVRVAVLMLALAALALVLAACNGDDAGTPAADGTPTSVPTEIATVQDSRDPAGGGIEPATADEPPPGTLVSEAGSVELGLGSYCWSPPLLSGNPAVCADAIGIITSPEDLTAAAGETLRITGEPGTLPWPPMTIEAATLWPAPEEPIDTGAGYRAWQPDGDGQKLDTEETTGEHRVTLPDDLAPGRYLLSLFYSAGENRGSDAMYGALIVIE